MSLLTQISVVSIVAADGVWLLCPETDDVPLPS